MRKNQEGEAMFRNCNSRCFSLICKALNRTISKGMDTTPHHTTVRPSPAQPSSKGKGKNQRGETRRLRISSVSSKLARVISSNEGVWLTSSKCSKMKLRHRSRSTSALCTSAVRSI